MYKLCVFGGTTEGRELVEFLNTQPCRVTACVATEYGQTLLPEGENLTVSARPLPVVRRMFPSVPDRKRTASSVFSANTASSGASDAPRSSRQCSTPAASQAAAMLLVIDAA